MASLVRFAAAALLATLPSLTRAAADLGYGADDDIFHFITRPDLKPPKWKITNYHPDEVTPGYWFVAPYAHIIQEPFARMYYQPCQTGPTIYDQTGELVWSGACQFRNQNCCDFRVFEANGSEYLSAILTLNRQFDPAGHAIIMDQTFELLATHKAPDTLVPFNMHEFMVIEQGQHGLHIIQKTEISDVARVEDTNITAGLTVNMGIREFNLITRETVFEWWCHTEIDWSESNFPSGNKLRGPFPDGWDWIHLNAIDKNEDGDYLITARYTDAIYKLSGKDKKIIYRLGGKKSDFELDGFQMSGPHDGRFMGTKDGKEYISFLDNGGDEQRKLADKSTAYILELDTTKKPWKASVVRSWERPDGGRSDKRGNLQILDNGNAFVGWSENSYISEHTPEGKLLMEAQFASKRFVSYRSYLFNYTTTPMELPVIKGFAYGTNPENSVSVYYTSWNGGTGVASWRFYNADDDTVIGEKEKKGFETKFQQTHTFAYYIYVEAIMEDGSVLEWSDPVAVELPEEWEAAPDPLKPLAEEPSADETTQQKKEAGVENQGSPPLVRNEL